MKLYVVQENDFEGYLVGIATSPIKAILMASEDRPSTSTVRMMARELRAENFLAYNDRTITVYVADERYR